MFCQELQNLLVGLEADIALRNQHTHDKFLSVGIWTENDIYDPADALLDVSTRLDAQQVLRDFLRGFGASSSQGAKVGWLFRI